MILKIAGLVCLLGAMGSFLCFFYYFFSLFGPGVLKSQAEKYKYLLGPFILIMPWLFTEDGKRLHRRMLLWLAVTAVFYVVIFGFFKPRTGGLGTI
jgi:hypothetical protein